ncbi:MAG TPA: hypothetical protein DD490_05040 [Acidobacteria bacterium]|nr:hypothetical protein [Acidobacteriota bacterium]
MQPLAALFTFALSAFPHTCSWVFTGGTPPTSTSCQPPPVVFTRTGPARVTLTVCAGPLCDSVSETIDVLEPKPRIVRVVPSPAEIYADQPLTLTAEATGKPSLAFSWKLPDGSLIAGNPVVIPPGRLSPSRATIRLTLTNEAGSAVRTFTPKILSPSPRIRSLALSPNPTYPRSQLTATAEATGRPPLTFRWTFPDGSTVEGASVTWAVPNLPAKSYPVVLTVSNASGSVSARRLLRVLPDAVIRAFDPVCPGACLFPLGQAVRFVISTTASTPRFEIDWNGDGVYDETVTTLEPLHIYETPGFFRPRIRVRLPDGRYETRTSSRSLTIHR